MRPFLENNRDKAILRKPDKLKKGDVVLAEISPQNYALHRIIKIIGENIVINTIESGLISENSSSKIYIKNILKTLFVNLNLIFFFLNKMKYPIKNPTTKSMNFFP